MKLSDILSAAKEYKREHGAGPLTVRINPMNAIEFAPKFVEMPVTVTLMEPADSFARDNIVGMEWYQDASVPVGQMVFSQKEQS